MNKEEAKLYYEGILRGIDIGQGCNQAIEIGIELDTIRTELSDVWPRTVKEKPNRSLKGIQIPNRKKNQNE